MTTISQNPNLKNCTSTNYLRLSLKIIKIILFFWSSESNIGCTTEIKENLKKIQVRMSNFLDDKIDTIKILQATLPKQLLPSRLLFA